MITREELTTKRDELSKGEHIYEPKYGGKDHSGYDTLMKYEVNYEREESFCAGFDACMELIWPEIEKLKEDNSFLANQALETATESLFVGYGRKQAEIWKESIENPLKQEIAQLKEKLAAAEKKIQGGA